MTSRLQSLVTLLRLGRMDLALGAMSNIWLMVFLAREVEPTGRRTSAMTDLPLWQVVLLTAIVAAGLHVYGAALNDVLDRRHDRLFRPNRPIPAGRINPSTAVFIGFASLLLGIFASVFLGHESMLLCLLAAVGVLFYDALGKFLPAIGLVTLGLMRAVNMFLPNPVLGFAWPIWGTMTHVIGCLAIAYWLEGKRPRLGASEWGLLVAAWAFWTLALLSWMSWRNTLTLHSHQGLWAAPAIAGAAFAVFTYRKLMPAIGSISARRTAGAGFLRVAMLWLMVYDAAWALAAGLYWQSLLHAGLLVLAIGLTRLAQEITEAAEEPVPGYRVDAEPLVGDITTPAPAADPTAPPSPK